MLNSLLSVGLGALTAYGFFNTNVAFIIPLCLTIFLIINKPIEIKNFGLFFISLNTIGSLWLLVPIHFIGGVNYIISILIIMVLGFFMGSIYALTLKLMRTFDKHAYSWLYILPTTIILSEFIKLHVIGGYPFLLYGYYLVDTPFKSVIPIIGLYGCSWLLTLICCLLAYTLREKKYKTSLIILSILFAFKLLNIQNYNYTKLKTSLNMYVIHTNNHYPSKYRKVINDINLKQKVDVALFPESMFTQIDQIPDLNADYILTGLIGYDYEKKGFYNTMAGLNNEHKIDFIHKKHHLAQFNEWIPKGLQNLLKAFDLPYHGFVAGNGKDTNGKIKNTKFMSVICYEMLFTDFIYNNINDANLIININDLGWFEKSKFENHFYQITRFMSALTQKPIVVSSNIGNSALIDPNGKTIYLTKNSTIEVNTNSGYTPWMSYGDNWVLVFIILVNGILYSFTIKTPLKDSKK